MQDLPGTGIAYSTQSGLAVAGSFVFSITFWPSHTLCGEGLLRFCHIGCVEAACDGYMEVEYFSGGGVC